MMSFNAACIELVEVLSAEFSVWAPRTQDVIDHDKQAMRYGNDRLLAPASTRNSVEQRVEVAIPHFHRVPGDLAHHGS
jgi:hypothetical protein